MTQPRLDALLQFLREDPNDPFNHYSLALEYVNLGRRDEAITAFQEALRLDPGYVPAYHQLGLLFGQMGRGAEAIETFTKGIALAERAGDTYARDEMEDAMQGFE